MENKIDNKRDKLSILKDRDFLRIFLALSVPIVIQNMFSTGLNFVSNIMIGRVGSTEAIASISIANKIYFLYDLIAFGLISGGAIFFAQYFGNKDFKSLRRTIGLILTMVISVSTIFVLLSLVFPKQLLSIFTKDPLVLEKGIIYLKTVAISYIFTGISFTLVMVMRAVNDTIKPMIASIIAILINVLLQYSLIYGKNGMPRLEVKGAAIATVIARFIEMALMAYFVFRKQSIVSGKIKEFISFTFEDFKKFISVSLPVVINESVWGLGTVVYSYAYAQISVSALTSAEIGSVVAEMFFIFSLGIAHGAGILIGNSLGADNKERAKKYGAAFIFMAAITGIFIGLLLFLLEKPILNLYSIDGITRANANTILILNAVLMPIRFLTTLFIIGILRGGGDTKYALFIEVMGLWVFGIPATFIAMYVFKAPIAIVWFMHFLEEFIKMILCIKRYKKGELLRKVI